MDTHKLNTTFKQMSNAAFNNMMLNEYKITPMHAQMERLYRAAKELKNISSPSELARELNASPQTVKNWESRGISKQGILDAQRVIGCSAEWIETGSGFMTTSLSNKNTEPGPEIRGLVPLISWVQAGSWGQTVDNFAPGDAEDWRPCPCTHGAHTFALRVRGVSMEPKYQDGDIIFVDPSVRPIHGKNVVVRLDDENEATFKQLVIEGGQMFLKPLNPDWPGPKLIQINGNATICGVVIGKWVPE